MKKYLLSILLSALPFTAFAACQGTQQPLIIAGQNVCGTVAATSSKGEISILRDS